MDTDKAYREKVGSKLHKNVTSYKEQILEAKLQLCDYLPSIANTFEIRRTSHAVYCWRNHDEPISDVLL